jgi:transcriptional regulator with XRE-family HTH domain
MMTTTEKVSQHIGQRLSARRQGLNLSLSDVAQRCGVTLQQIHRYETGENAISAPMLWSLARCLNAPITYFFEGLSAKED